MMHPIVVVKNLRVLLPYEPKKEGTILYYSLFLNIALSIERQRITERDSYTGLLLVVL